jgi:hypothetical protein
MKTKLMPLLILLAAWILTASSVKADSVTVGDVEFDNLFTGVNVFTVNNFTGSDNLGFFPVKVDVTFENIVLTATESDNTVLVFDILSLTPGTDTSSQVPANLLFTKVTLTATLSPSTFGLTNGSSGTFAADPTVSFTLLPSSGPHLTAGTDLGVLNATNGPTAPAIEPPMFMLLFVGLVGIAILAKRQRFSASFPPRCF